MITVHWILSLLSYVAFLVAFVSGALFLIQDAQLKHKHMGVLFHRLPSLQALDGLNFRAITTGFALLTVGMLAGMGASRRVLGVWWSWDPKESITLVLWLSYLALWLVRARATLRGRKVAVFSILGFTFAVVTWLGVSRWLPTWHPYV